MLVFSNEILDRLPFLPGMPQDLSDLNLRGFHGNMDERWELEADIYIERKIECVYLFTCVNIYKQEDADVS